MNARQSYKPGVETDPSRQMAGGFDWSGGRKPYAAMSESAAPVFSAELVAPERRRHEQGLPPSPFLQELWAVRGLVLFDHGRRPAFRLTDGTFADPDPLDAAAHHIVFRLEERMVACARIALLSDVASGTIAALIGQRRFEEILNGIGTTTAETCEGARWTVVPDCRKHGLGRKIIIASWTVARWLGVKTALVLAGTRNSQDQALCRLGARPVDGLPLVPAPRFDDELRLLYFDISNPSEPMQKRIDEVAMLLRLGKVPVMQPCRVDAST